MDDSLTDPVDLPRRSPDGGGRGCLKGGGCLVMSGALLLLLGVAGLVYALTEARRLSDTVTESLLRPQPTPVLSAPSVIIERLRGASELTTAIVTVETLVDASQDRTLGPFTVGRKRLLYVAHGDVRAGVDLSALSEADVTVWGDQVTVRLPPPRILDRKIDVARSRVFDIDSELLAPPAPELQTQAERYALERILEAACEGGILERANERAALTVRTLLAATGAQDLVVVTQAPLPEACPTPAPAPPGSPPPAATLTAPLLLPATP